MKYPTNIPSRDRPAPSAESSSRPSAMLVPTVIEQTHRGERGWDIFSRLLKDRVVFIGTEIDDDVANVVIAQLLFLDSEDQQRHHALHQLAGRLGTSGFRDLRHDAVPPL